MRNKRKPSYSLHKSSGQARVRIDGKDYYLGPYGSRDSHDRYDDLIDEWRARDGNVSGYTLTVDDLALLFIQHADLYYRHPNGEPTGEADSIRHALRVLLEMFGTCRVRQFGPKKLKQVREELIRRGHVRTNINRLVERMKRMFNWGVADEHVSAELAAQLASVKGLRKGRSKAIESEPVEPVEMDVVEATLPFLTPTVVAMVQLQLLTGSRPGEIRNIRPCDVTFGTDGVWRYSLDQHKTSYRGNDRRIHIGPKGQQILRPFLDRDAEDFCFTPAQSMSERNAERRANRKSPMTPSQAARKPKTNPKYVPSEKYTKDSYNRAIRRACEKAFNMPRELRVISSKLPESERDRLKALASEWRSEHCWTPHQLRHAQATLIRRQYNLEASQVYLGVSDPKTAEIYAEKDFALAAKIAKEIG